MSENLKVNAKTSLLEFKRKHNKSVDKLNLSVEDITELKAKIGQLVVSDLPSIADNDNPTQAELEACFGKAFKIDSEIECEIFIPYYFTEDETYKIYVYSSLYGVDEGATGIDLYFIQISYDKVNEDYSYERFDYNLRSLIEQNGGTKLYKHTIIDSNVGYTIILISTSNEPLNFSSLDTYQKVATYLQSIEVISFKFGLQNMQYDGGDFFIIGSDGNTSTFVDWDLSASTDTVTEL